MRKGFHEWNASGITNKSVNSVPSGDGPANEDPSRRQGAMLDLRRSTAAALLVGAALVPALAAAPANAVGSSSTAVLAAAADWVYYGTYPDSASCDAAGQENPYGAPWECRPSTQPGAQPGEYDLYVWSSDGPE